MSEPGDLGWRPEEGWSLALLPQALAGLLGMGVPSEHLCWIAPPSVMVGRTRAYGLDVLRADVPYLVLGFRTYGGYLTRLTDGE